jgi:endonuclease-3
LNKRAAGALQARDPFSAQPSARRALILLFMAPRTGRLARRENHPATPAPVQRTVKRPIDIDVMMRRIREAIRPFKKAAMFELAERGFDSVFQQLVACIISIRTRDEQTIPISLRLFEVAKTPAEVARLSVERIGELITPSTFREPKARTIHEIAQATVARFNGELPCDPEVLMSFKGVGPKCANLALGIACNRSHIGVDIHVHRVTNRWGYVEATTPEKTMVELERVLPKKYWVEINRLLVPFGKHVCTGVSPKCSTCPVLQMCRQFGVTDHR